MAAGSDRFLVTSRVWLKVSDLKWKPGMVDSVQGNEVSRTRAQKLSTCSLLTAYCHRQSAAAFGSSLTHVLVTTRLQVVVRTEDGQIVKVSRGSDIISQRTPPSMVLVDDLTQLPDLDEPNMLNSLCTRTEGSRSTKCLRTFTP